MVLSGQACRFFGRNRSFGVTSIATQYPHQGREIRFAFAPDVMAVAALTQRGTSGNLCVSKAQLTRTLSELFGEKIHRNDLFPSRPTFRPLTLRILERQRIVQSDTHGVGRCGANQPVRQYAPLQQQALPPFSLHSAARMGRLRLYERD